MFTVCDLATFVVDNTAKSANPAITFRTVEHNITILLKGAHFRREETLYMPKRTTPFTQWPQIKSLKSIKVDRPLGCNGWFVVLFVW